MTETVKTTEFELTTASEDFATFLVARACEEYPISETELRMLLPVVISYSFMISMMTTSAKQIADGEVDSSEAGKSLKAIYDLMTNENDLGTPLMARLPRVGNFFKVFQAIQNYMHQAFLPEAMENVLKADLDDLEPEINEILARAIENNDTQFIKMCDDEGILVPGLLADHKDLMHKLYSAGRFETLKMCFDNGLFGITAKGFANVDKKDASGMTGLMKACRDGNFEKAARLLAMGADPKIVGPDGNTALHFAVSYTEEELSGINKDARDRTPEVKALMERKAEIVKMLLKDHRVSIDATNDAGKTPFKIATEQGLKEKEITMGQKVYLLYGDHKIMQALLNAGADPVFGMFHLSYKCKTAITAALSIALTYAKNALIRWTGIGFATRFFFWPALKVINYSLDAVVAYKGYLDAHAPLYSTVFSRLAHGVQYELKGKVMIGEFHTTWYGKVVFGEGLKSYMDRFTHKHTGYNNISSAIWTIDSLPQHEDGAVRMTQADMRELGETLYSRYYKIQEQLANHWLAPWTREGLERTARETLDAFDMTTHGYGIPGFSSILIELFAEENHEHMVKEALASEEYRTIFYNLNTRVKSGALSVDLEARYLLEKFEQKLRDPRLLEKTRFEKFLAKSKSRALVKSPARYTFARFAEGYKALDMDKTLSLMEAFYDLDLKEDRDVRTFWERVCEVTGQTVDTVADGTVRGLAWVTGASAEKVCGVAAEAVAHTGATANAAAHVGFREFLDSWFFIPTIAAAATGYMLYKFPSQTWAAMKFTYNAVSTVVCGVYAAVNYAVHAITMAAHYTAMGALYVASFVTGYDPVGDLKIELDLEDLGLDLYRPSEFVIKPAERTSTAAVAA